MRRLDRYIFAEILGPLLLGFFVYTVILLLQALFKSADLIITSGVAVGSVARLLLLSMPWIVVMTIPMSLLFGILIAVGRLSSDSELVAMRSSGISLFSLYRPILLLSALLTGANIYLMTEILPAGNQALRQLQVEILTQSLTDEVQPRVPYTGWQNQVLYVFESPPGERRWRGVFLSESIPNQRNQVVVADWGRAETNDDGEVVLSLDNALNHRVNLDNPTDYNLIAHQVFETKLAAPPRQEATSVKRGLRELKLDQLKQRARDSSAADSVRRLARVEIQKKFSIPSACLVFGLLGLPLGFNNARGARSAGFAISIGVILIYYVLLNSGEDLARDGTLPPWLAVWFPNLALLVLGLFLLTRRNRDKSLLLARFGQLVPERLGGVFLRLLEGRRRRRAARSLSRAAADRPRPQVLLRLPEMRLRFPNTIDRYVLGIFARVLVLATLGGVTVYLVADLTDTFDEILENGIPRHIVIDYYKFKSFAIFHQISPIIVMVTTLITFGLLSRSNEITACKALGLSLFRLSLPVLLAAGAIAALGGLLQSEILPASNSRAIELEMIIRGQEELRPSHRADRRWLYGKGNKLYNFAYFDPDERLLHRLQVFRFDSRYRLTGRLMADQARYLDDGWWMLSSGWIRSWDGDQETEYRTFDQAVKHRLGETPEYFSGGMRRPEEMNYPELRDYVRELRGSGQEVPQLEVALYDKIAYPLVSLVMAVVALPFAFRMGRQGALYGIGLSLVMGVVLLIILGVFYALGENAILPPLVAVMSPGAIFAIFGLYLFLGVRT